MYKINYKDVTNSDKSIDNIESVAIDVIDVAQMKYIDVIYQGDINLLSLYVKCLKHYNGKVNIFDRFIISNNYPENEEIIKSILDCNWLINEDDFENNPEMLEEKAEEFKDEIAELHCEETLKNVHRSLLMRHYIRSYNRVRKNKEKVKALHKTIKED